MYAAQLGRMAGTLRARGIEVLIVGRGSEATARRVRSLLRLPFPVLADPERSAYRAFGLEKVAVLIQRSGTFLVDRDGIVRLARHTTNPYVAMRRDELLAALEDLPAPPEAT